jgi:RsiW-degrading membrane proteinase PrsW (M82 family)
VTEDEAALAALKGRFQRMAALVVLALIVGVIGLVCYFVGRQPFGLFLVVAALVGGFAAQVWFLAAFRSARHR